MRGAGVMFFCSTTNRVLFLLRGEDCDSPLTWAFPGGKVEEGETLREAAQRETYEEISYTVQQNKLLPLYSTEDKGFKFYCYWTAVKTEFRPVLNDEHLKYAWYSKLPTKIHKKCLEGLQSVETTPDSEAAKFLRVQWDSADRQKRQDQRLQIQRC